MKTRIVALKNSSDFRSLLKGRKLSNKYFVMFYKKILSNICEYPLIDGAEGPDFIIRKKKGSATTSN